MICNLMSDYRARNNRKKQGRGGTTAKLHVTAVFLIVLVSFLTCFIIYMVTANLSGARAAAPTDKSQALSSNGSASLDQKSSSTPAVTTPSATTSPPAVNPVPENPSPADRSYLASCAFVGDSLTVGLSAYGILPEKDVLAAQGMNIDKINNATITTANGETTILEALKARKPENIYIMLGSNGIAWLSNERMISEYSEFVDSVKSALPDSVIYILSIPPVSVVAETLKQPILNSDIDVYNSELLKMANEKKLHFVDINTALKGNDGKLPQEYSNQKDGMHFQKATYDIMLEYILKHTAPGSEQGSQTETQIPDTTSPAGPDA